MPVPAPTVEVAARRRWTRSAVHVPVVLELETVTAAATCASAVDVASQCPTARAKRQCFTRAQVEDRIRNPPGLRPPEDAGPGDAGLAPLDVPSEPNGCYAPRYVQSGCCNPAYAVEREGDECCYLWCDMACCGRPMVVRGEARAATMVEASAWSVASEEPSSRRSPTRYWPGRPFPPARSRGRRSAGRGAPTSPPARSPTRVGRTRRGCRRRSRRGWARSSIPGTTSAPRRGHSGRCGGAGRR